MPKRLLITGARGFVAGSVIMQADDAWEVHAISRGPAPHTRPNLVWHQADALDPASFGEVLNTVRPESILHAGAIPNIDYSETNREDALLVNTRWTERVAALAETYNARLVYCSTDNVFRGDRSMYSEDDAPDPVNHYGHTKLWGEDAVRRCAAPWVIARIAVVMGIPPYAPGKTSVTSLLESLARGETVHGSKEEWRTPIDVMSLGASLLELCGNEWTGTIHLAGTERVSRYDLMRAIAEACGYGKGAVEEGLPAPGPQRAPRPIDCSLDTTLAQGLLDTPMLGLRGMAARIAQQAKLA